MNEPQNENRQILNIPTAIIIAGAIIAGAVIYTMKPTVSSNPNSVTKQQAQIKPVTNSDHILGNPNAPIKIVEYSDPACPFCKTFHNTMRQVMQQYGAGGQVAWVYRSFPIDKPGTRPDGGILHPNAGHESQAMECAASIGGNAKFWTYTNRLYEITPSVTGNTPNGLDQKELYNIAKYAGLDGNEFKTCLDSGRFKDKVEASYLEAINIGMQGTPSTIIIIPSGKNIAIEGAQSFDTMKQTIDALIADQAKK